MWWLMAGLLGCEGASEPEPAPEDTALDCTFEESTTSPLELEGRARCGADLYADACASCHGEDGSGTELGADLEQHIPYHTDAEIVLVLVTGPESMEPQELAPQETADVIAHLRDWFGDYQGSTHPTR